MDGSQSWLWCILCNFLLPSPSYCAIRVKIIALIMCFISVDWLIYILLRKFFFRSLCLRKDLQKTLRKRMDVLAKSRYVMLIFLSLKFRQWTFSWNCFELRIPFKQSCCHVKDGCKMRSTFLFWCCHNLFYHNRKYFNATSMKNIFCKIA